MDSTSQDLEEMTPEELRVELRKARSESQWRTLLAMGPSIALLMVWALTPVVVLVGLPEPYMVFAGFIHFLGGLLAAWLVIHVARDYWGTDEQPG